MSTRVTVEDLRFAAEWLSVYDGGAEGAADEMIAARDRVVTWLSAEIDRREDAIGARAVSKAVGRKVTPAEFRAVAR